MKLSKLFAAMALGLGLQAANAGVITVIIDDFGGSTTSLSNGGVSATTGGVTANVGPNLGANGGTPNFYNVSADAGILGTATLTYPAIALPSGATGATVNYLVVFNDLGVPSTNANQIIVGGVTNSYGTSIGLGAASSVPGSGPYTPSGGTFSTVFTNPGTRSWDMSIDNLGVSFECGSRATGGGDRSDGSYSLANYLSTFGLSGQSTGGAVNCGAVVPLPGSLALLGLGGLVAGLVARRRTSK